MQPSTNIAILEIITILAGNVFSLVVGILALVFYNDVAVRDYFARINGLAPVVPVPPVPPVVPAPTPEPEPSPLEPEEIAPIPPAPESSPATPEESTPAESAPEPASEETPEKPKRSRKVAKK